MHTNSLLSLHNSAKKVEKGPTVVESALNQNREYFKTAMQNNLLSEHNFYFE